MSIESHRPRRIGALVVVVLLLGAAIAALVLRMQALPDGPEPVAWDREACAHCRMHVSEPRFAAQLQTREGSVLNFDDPGCLFAYVRQHGPTVHAIYFHAFEGDRWLAQSDVGFVTHAGTPMGYGLVAVRRSDPGAIPYEQALSRTASIAHPAEAQR